MIRKEFLHVLGGAGLASAAMEGQGQAPAFRAARTVSDFSYEIGAAPEAVFPLLCPVREYEWLDGWSAEMVYSRSGVAEENCVFRTPAAAGWSTWTTVRYEPPVRIEYVWVNPGNLVTHLTITLEPVAPGRTRLRWQRAFTGLSEAGSQEAANWTDAREREIGRRLEHFLKTGTMLRAGKV